MKTIFERFQSLQRSARQTADDRKKAPARVLFFRHVVFAAPTFQPTGEAYAPCAIRFIYNTGRSTKAGVARTLRRSCRIKGAVVP